MGKIKVLLVLSVFWIFLAGTLRPVQAAGTNVSIIPVNTAVATEDTFTVDVKIAPGVAIAGAQFDLSFDPSVLEITGVTEGNLLNQGGANTYFSPGTTDNTAGTITGVAGAITTAGAEVSDEGVFAAITFKAKKTGVCSLELSNVIVGNKAGIAVQVEVTNGQMEVVGPGEMDSDKDGIPDVWETAHGLNPDDKSDALQDRDSDGVTNIQEYIREAIQSAEEAARTVERRKWDVNDDGKTGLEEAIHALRVVSGM